ncbi:MFS general substrate transporter [Lindgomyces ingoldianus]|uniref:MFS general substrate transporter n=1 Tax=Lindgomyces ingoldianus TaxID=673940 RepID=A0ACB6Q936_9PLEO|nr:MFS general substrate transporter [Lindgomyces ingoldianus]KAF2463426.1 MFS general substrate transporter [Lindgomyces ingoldianus]
MDIGEKSPLVGIIVSVYYLGCAARAVLFSRLADQYGRKKSIFLCLATACLENLVMFISGLGYKRRAIGVMVAGRVVMGLGVGGVDAVIPTSVPLFYSQELQFNIFGLVMAFGINLGVTEALGEWSQWEWRIPIIVMQIYPVLLMAFVERLPESPRWLVYHRKENHAQAALNDIYGNEGDKRFDELMDVHEKEKGTYVGYLDMLTPTHPQLHPTIITIMGQINQALTGYGAVFVYGPQIFELLSFPVRTSEYLTLGNYSSDFMLMTIAWPLIDALGRRKLLIQVSVLLLAMFSGLTTNASTLHIHILALGILGTLVLFLATGHRHLNHNLGDREFRHHTAPSIIFNNLSYFIFVIFAATNWVAGLWTWIYLPESGGRSFEENQEFFREAKEAGTWRVRKVNGGEFAVMKYPDPETGGDAVVDVERVPLSRRVEDQLPSV